MTARTILITGAGRGIGQAAAIRFARGGGRMVLVARTESELLATAAAINRPDDTLCIPADVSNEDDAARIMSLAIERFGRIDVLVNNAAVAPMSPIERFSTADFDRMVAVNIRGVFLMCRGAWAALSERGGVIVNLSSRGATDPFPGFSAYGGSKAFVETFTRALAAEGASRGIRVYAVAPGAVATTMLHSLFPKFPANKSLDPDEVAELIERLCGDAPPVDSGATVPIERQ